MKKTLFIIIFSMCLTTAFAARVLLHHNYSGPGHMGGWDWEGLIAILEIDGHHVVLDTVSAFPDLNEFGIWYSLLADSLSDSDISVVRRFVGRGGRAILLGEWPTTPNRYLNVLLADPEWDDSLGIIRNNLDRIRDWPCDTVYPPWDTLELSWVPQRFPNFHRSSGFFNQVDTVKGVWASSFSILSPDSGTARPFVWGAANSTTTLGDYDSFAVLSIKAEYGLGSIILIGDILNWLEDHSISYDTIIYGLDHADNRQFIRNLFTTNDRADTVRLTGTDSSFTIFLPGSTPFIAGSTSFSFESASYGLWELCASDWSYWHTDSSITIQYPDTCPMGTTFEVCVKLVPDATGETVLPCGEVCDSFTFDYTAISEVSRPEEFAISAHPNPFNSAVRIIAPENTTIEIFDIDGKHIAKLSKNESIWHPSEYVSNGIYLIRATNGSNVVSKSVFYIK